MRLDFVSLPNTPTRMDTCVVVSVEALSLILIFFDTYHNNYTSSQEQTKAPIHKETIRGSGFGFDPKPPPF